MPSGKPLRVTPEFKERIWGTPRLSPWFADSERKIGEVWFDAGLPLLVKFIFTSERLSVQVHPDDTYAAAHHQSRGKTEMWHILRADEGAQLAVGLAEPVAGEALRTAAEAGQIEGMLRWVPAKAGDTYLIHAGTVHAIGGGIALCEIQQNSDVTYRLYDYGRGRELHLEKAIDVTDPQSEGIRCNWPVESAYFRTEHFEVAGDYRLAPEGAPQFLIALEGSGTIGGEPVQAGEVWLAPGGTAPFSIRAESPMKWLRAQEPAASPS